jgi:predicted dithiol-disulfide oxidoreductase (DUF899 family)
MENHGNVRFPNESDDYRRARAELLEAEKRLRRVVEEVAALRRRLPPGGVVPEDYVFEELDLSHPERGPHRVKLSDSFGTKRTLVVYSYMFGPKMANACPFCTSILDGLDGETPHVAQRAAFVVVAKNPVAKLRSIAEARRWKNLRLLSSAENTFNRDYHAENESGGQNPLLHVFTKQDGVVRHFWSSELLFAEPDPGQDPRHVDQLWPLWHLLDATPEGRGDFHPRLAYETAAS